MVKKSVSAKKRGRFGGRDLIKMKYIHNKWSETANRYHQ